ncbi:MAG TPA: TPM domain-containing protein [Thermoanaerobaculia bacterium]|nr:TPM domain-containing protein [Thermoanaerobaculia bacterium]
MNIRRSAIAFIAIALIASAALALDIPPKPTQWVNDYNANLLNAAQIQQLNEKLEAFYKQTGVQFLIMIFPSLEGEDDLGYTNKVANMWKVKDEKALMFFVFAKEHKTRIQVSYSLEPVITDAFSSDVLHNTVPTYFRAGDYAGGLNAAVDQIAKKIDPNFVSTTTTPVAAPRQARSSKGGGADMFFPSIFFLFVIFVLLPLLMRGRRRGGCGGCFWPMFFGGGGWGGGGTTFGGGGGGGWSTGGSWGGGGSSFGGGGAGGGW